MKGAVMSIEMVIASYDRIFRQIVYQAVLLYS